MESVNTYSKYIKGYFSFTNNSDYIFNIIEVDNINLTEQNKISFEVSIDFIPKEYEEYNFDVIETTSSYLNLKNNGNDYIINIINIINENSEDNNNITTITTTSTPDKYLDEEVDDYDDYDEADGYDSEGYYFRLRYVPS